MVVHLQPCTNLLFENECYLLNGDVLCDKKGFRNGKIHFSNNANGNDDVYNMISPLGFEKMSKNLIL